MTTLTPGSLWVSGSFGGAGCVSFNFSADVPLDVFLSTKLDLVGMLDAEQVDSALSPQEFPIAFIF